MSRARDRVVVVLGLLLAAACARPDDWVRTHPDIAAEARRDPQSFVDAAGARWDGVHGFAGSYRVRASRGVGSRTLDVQVYVLRDALLTVEVLAPGAATAEAYLTAGRSEIGLWSSEENVLYRGALEPGAFQRALGLELEPEDVVAALMGYEVVGHGGVAPASSWDDARQRIRVDSGPVSAWLHPQTGRFERAMVRSGAGLIEVIFEEWTQETAPLPTRLTIAVPDQDITLRLRLAASLRLDPPGLDPAFFDILPVRGASQAPLETLAAEGGLLRRWLRER